MDSAQVFDWVLVNKTLINSIFHCREYFSLRLLPRVQTQDPQPKRFPPFHADAKQLW